MDKLEKELREHMQNALAFEMQYKLHVDTLIEFYTTSELHSRNCENAGKTFRKTRKLQDQAKKLNKIVDYILSGRD